MIEREAYRVIVRERHFLWRHHLLLPGREIILIILIIIDLLNHGYDRGGLVIAMILTLLWFFYYGCLLSLNDIYGRLLLRVRHNYIVGAI